MAEIVAEQPAKPEMPDRVVQKHRTIFSSLPVQIFMIHAIKKPLMESVNELGSLKCKGKIAAVKQFQAALTAIDKLPEPTKENTWHPNTHKLITLRDSLRRHWLLGLVLKLPGGRQLVKFGIVVYDFDPPWRWIIDGMKDRLLTSKWTLSNLLQTRDWLCGCLALNETRMQFIRRVMNLAIMLYFTPCRPLMDYVKRLATRVEWQRRGYEDTWSPKYTWWKEDADKPAA